MARKLGSRRLLGMGLLALAAVLGVLSLALALSARVESNGAGVGAGLAAQVRRDFPKLINLVETDRLDIGSMVSRRIKLDEVNDAFRAMEAGEVIRSVIV